MQKAEECEEQCWLNTQKSFGDRLAFLRAKKGLSQGKLADKADLNQGYVSLYERNLVVPTITTLEKLCKALNITASELLGY